LKNLARRFQSFSETKFFPLFCYLWLGGFSTLAFLPWKLSQLVWIAPFALFWLEKRYRGQWKKQILHGFLAGVSVSIFSYHWITHLLVVFGGFPFFLAVPLFLLYAFVTNFRFPLFILLFSFLRKKLGKGMIWLAGAVILFTEFFTFQLFPYYFGNLLAGNLYFSQNVEYIGVYGLSVLVFIVSYALFRSFGLFLRWNQRSKKTIHKLLLWPLGLVIFFFFTGVALYVKWKNVSPAFSQNVMMIQPDAPLEFRDGRFRETIENLMQKIEDLAAKGAKDTRPDIIVLPESGVPFFSTHNTEATTLYNRSYYERFEALMYLLAVKYKASVYFNEVDAVFLGGKPRKENQRFFNSSVVFDPNGNRKDSYHKVYLLAFGEYFPLGETFPIIYDIIPQVGRFLPGQSQNLLDYYNPKTEIPAWNKSHLRWMDSSFMNMKGFRDYYQEREVELETKGKFLPLICYEVIIPEFVRKFYSEGNPDFIINITNDKWYGKSMESFQHLELARLRSIEHRRWMVRSTNSGTSVFVNHLGEVVSDVFTGLETSEVYSTKVDIIRTGPRFYVQFGNLLAWLYLLGTGIYFLQFFLIKKKQMSK
jgi:apolipoprotein N-acyltransferase